MYSNFTTWQNRVAALSIAAATILLTPAFSYAANQSCTVDFSNRAALANMFQQASWTFAVASTVVNTQIVQWTKRESSPTSAQTDLNRWQYRQGCDGGRISVWDQYDGHFHLSFRDPTLSCLAANGFGRMIGRNCVAPTDYTLEPRVAISHDGSAWWEILLLNYQGLPNPAGSPGAVRAFDLKTIAVGGTTPIQMWFRKIDGSVWGFSKLGAGTNWDVSGSASGIVAVWISAVSGNDEPFTIDGFTLVTR
jgi:hypothetical protein